MTTSVADPGAALREAAPKAPAVLRADPDAATTAGGVQWVTDAAGFAALRPEWNELLQNSAADNPFLTWEWLCTWWTRLAGSSGLRLMTVRDGGELIAIAPLRLVGATLHWFSRLEFLGTGHAGSDYLDIIVRRGRESETAKAIADTMACAGLALRFEHTTDTGTIAAVARRLAAAGWAATEVQDGTCPVVSLAGHTWDSFLATLGSSHRANFRRRLRALEHQFDVRFDRVNTDRERQDALHALIGYSEARWKEQGGSTAFLTPDMRAFQEEATHLALADGWLRMYVLRLNAQIAAVMYGFARGGRFYFYQHGFDDRYRAQSVGLVLMGVTIRAALEEGLHEFDMLWGIEPYKFLWGRNSRTLRRFELFPLHLSGMIHRRAMTARRSVRRLARRVLSIGDPFWS